MTSILRHTSRNALIGLKPASPTRIYSIVLAMDRYPDIKIEIFNLCSLFYFSQPDLMLNLRVSIATSRRLEEWKKNILEEIEFYSLFFFIIFIYKFEK